MPGTSGPIPEPTQQPEPCSPGGARPPAGEIIATDFGSIGFAQPLSTLLAQVPDSASRIRAVDPLQNSWRSTGDTIEAHAESQALALLERGLRPSPAFLGQCAGISFTAQLAACAERAGVRPASVILVRPVVPLLSDVAEQVSDLVARIGGNAEAAEEIVARLPAFAPGDRWALTQYLDRRLRAILGTLMNEPGLDESDLEFMLDELVGRYVDWLGFLSAHLAQPALELAARVHVVGAENGAIDAVHSLLPRTDVTVWPTGDRIEADLIAELIAGTAGGY